MRRSDGIFTDQRLVDWRAPLADWRRCYMVQVRDCARKKMGQVAWRIKGFINRERGRIMADKLA